MSWTWQLEKADGTVLVARGLPKETFSSQGDAGGAMLKPLSKAARLVVGAG